MRSKKAMPVQKESTKELSETECKIFLCLEELLSTGSTKVANITVSLNK
jgi:hypothetical protein